MATASANSGRLQNLPGFRVALDRNSEVLLMLDGCDFGPEAAERGILPLTERVIQLPVNGPGDHHRPPAVANP